MDVRLLVALNKNTKKRLQIIDNIDYVQEKLLLESGDEDSLSARYEELMKKLADNKEKLKKTIVKIVERENW